ncbi:isochorismatase family protein [Endozoicomonas arenosclerae]|uniref:isochorismatase family protein n=1 Tax=Endozoicomonas arenosclerae TaxID=1633495 RepID=UPI000783CFDD|nr:isochorismatase family protein [Endozoicomonas arenosclerae]
MKLSDFFIAIFLLINTPSVQAGVEESLQYIERLLSEGKKVAVILMDMQEGFIDPALKNYGAIIQEQIRLLDSLSGKPGVHILDVNYDPHQMGNTLPGLLASIKRNVMYKLISKNTDNVFDSYKTIKLPSGREMIQNDNVLDTYLKGEGIKDVFITGCYDGACILNSVKGGLERDYRMIVDRELNIVDHTEGLESFFAGVWKSLKDKSSNLTLISDSPRKEPCQSK